MIQSVRTALQQSFVVTSLLVATLGVATAQVMTSSNFQMQSDSVNFAGNLASSTNYQLESTAGEVATGESSSSNYQLRAGYQQMQRVYIALSDAADVAMNLTIPGVTGGISNGSTTVTVTTDSAAGYSLTIEAENSPAMQKGVDSIADYSPVGAAPDFSFLTGASDSHFGFSPHGVDVVQRFLDNGAICNTGSSNATSTCWDGLSTTAQTVAQSSGPNHPSGATTTVRFRVGIGSSAVQAAGLYTATTTLTALPL